MLHRKRSTAQEVADDRPHASGVHAMTEHKMSPLLGILSALVVASLTTTARAQVDAPHAPSQTKAKAPTPEPGCHDDEKADEGLPPPAQNEPQPRLECDHPQIFTKPVWRGEMATMSFNVRNDGDGNLILLIGRT